MNITGYSTDTYKGQGHDELHVFVDALDYETAKSRIYERLADEWDLARGFIDFSNLWSESELRDMAVYDPGGAMGRDER